MKLRRFTQWAYLAALLLLPVFGYGAIVGSLPFTLTNGTVADANSVMSNFNTLLNGVNTNAAHNGANTDITSLSNLSALTVVGPMTATSYNGGCQCAPPEGRLTLATATPVMTGTTSAASSVFYTPYRGNMVPLWNGVTFQAKNFAEVSQTLADATKSPLAGALGSVYDMFAWSDAGTFRVTRGFAWTNATTRCGSCGLTNVQGILTNTSSITNGPGAGFGTYVGTIATDAGAATVTWNLGGAAVNGTAAVMNVFNYYNRIDFFPLVVDTTSSTAYVTATIRALNLSNTNRITFVTGVQEDIIDAKFVERCDTGGTTATCIILIGLDSTSAEWSADTRGLFNTGTSVGKSNMVAQAEGYAGLGQHFLQALQLGDGTNSNLFFGQPYEGLTAKLRM